MQSGRFTLTGLNNAHLNLSQTLVTTTIIKFFMVFESTNSENENLFRIAIKSSDKVII